MIYVRIFCLFSVLVLWCYVLYFKSLSHFQFIFVFVSITLGDRLKKILQQFMSRSVLPMFFSRIPMVFGPIFRFLIHFEFILVFYSQRTFSFHYFTCAIMNFLHTGLPISCGSCSLGSFPSVIFYSLPRLKKQALPESRCSSSRRQELKRVSQTACTD